MLFTALFFNAFTQQNYDVESKDFAVKFTPTQLMLGDFILGFEARTGNKSSIDINVGPTFGGFGFAPLLMIRGADISSDYFSVKSKVGASFSVGYRYYAVPSKTRGDLNGLYLNPTLQFKSLKGVAEKNSPYGDTESTYKMTQFSGAIYVGYQFAYNNGFVLDVFMASGVALKKYESNKPYQILSEDGQSIELLNYKLSAKRLTPHFNIGVRLGFGGNFK